MLQTKWNPFGDVIEGHTAHPQTTGNMYVGYYPQSSGIIVKITIIVEMYYCNLT